MKISFWGILLFINIIIFLYFVAKDYHLFCSREDSELLRNIEIELQKSDNFSIGKYINYDKGDMLCFLPKYRSIPIYYEIREEDRIFINKRINNYIGKSDGYWWIIVFDGKKTNSPKMYKITGKILPEFKKTICYSSGNVVVERKNHDGFYTYFNIMKI